MTYPNRRFLFSMAAGLLVLLLFFCPWLPVSALAAEEAADPAGIFLGSGTDAAPYQISTAEQLAALGKGVAANDKRYCTASFLLTADISLNDTAGYAAWTDTPPKNVWTPIGCGQKWNYPFGGTFDGGGHSISGLYIGTRNGTVDWYENGNCCGLFGYTDGADIRNLKLEKAYINLDFTDNKTKSIGCLIAHATRTVITDVSVEGDMTVVGLNSDECGLLVSDALWTTILRCTAEGTVSLRGYGTAGGLVASCTLSSVTDCVNRAKVSHTEDTLKDYTGGIAGWSYGAVIENCTNKGAIYAPTDFTGGITGYMTYNEDAEEQYINACVNTASVTGRHAGGLIGEYSATGSITGVNATSPDSKHTLKNCANSGRITGLETAGGIFGRCTMDATLNVEGLQNTGRITVSPVDEMAFSLSAGGLFGSLQTYHGGISVKDCKNTAPVSIEGKNVRASGEMGGIVGSITTCGGSTSIDNCRNTGALTADTRENSTLNVGGIAGTVGIIFSEDDESLSTVSHCENTGSISGTISFAGGIAGYLQRFDNGTFTTVQSCINRGDITLTSAASVGGIAGAIPDIANPSQEGESLIENCLNEGSLHCTGVEGEGPTIGGIVGMSYRGRERACLNMGTLETDQPIKFCGGIVGKQYLADDKSIPLVQGCYFLDTCGAGETAINSPNGLGTEDVFWVSAESARKQETFTNLNFDTDWQMGPDGWPVPR